MVLNKLVTKHLNVYIRNSIIFQERFKEFCGDLPQNYFQHPTTTFDIVISVVCGGTACNGGQRDARAARMELNGTMEYTLDFNFVLESSRRRHIEISFADVF